MSNHADDLLVGGFLCLHHFGGQRLDEEEGMLITSVEERKMREVVDLGVAESEGRVLTQRQGLERIRKCRREHLLGGRIHGTDIA